MRRPVLGVIARLEEITGIGRGAAQVIVAELGTDMTQFPTPGHAASWAKLTPRAIQSGATSKAGRTGKGNPYLRGATGVAVMTAARTETFLGARYRRHARRRGKQKAIVAGCRTIIEIAWRVIAGPASATSSSDRTTTTSSTPGARPATRSASWKSSTLA